MEMTIIKDCKYRLPCGWCDRKNELCQYEAQTVATVLDKLPEEVLNTTPAQPSLDKHITNDPVCDHEWYCSGADTLGWSYTCRKCGKTERRNYSHLYTPGTPLWLNPDAPDINRVGDFPPYNEVTCTSGYINTNHCPEQQVDSILTTNVTTCAQSTAHELSEAEKFVAEVKSGNLPKMKEKK